MLDKRHKYLCISINLLVWLLNCVAVWLIVILGKAQVFLITWMIALLCSSGPVSHDSLTVNQQRGDWKGIQPSLILITYTCIIITVTSLKSCCLFTYSNSSFLTSCGTYLLRSNRVCSHHEQSWPQVLPVSTLKNWLRLNVWVQQPITCRCMTAGMTAGNHQTQISQPIIIMAVWSEYDHLPNTWHCSVTDKQPAMCPHCSSQFVNQSVLEIHMQRCPITEEEKTAGRGRGQGRGRSTGQVERKPRKLKLIVLFFFQICFNKYSGNVLKSCYEFPSFHLIMFCIWIFILVILPLVVC